MHRPRRGRGRFVRDSAATRILRLRMNRRRGLVRAP
jgi:hypothetical protein